MYFIDFSKIEKEINVKIPLELRLLNFIDLGTDREVISSNSDFNVNNFIYPKGHILNWNEDIIIDYFIPNKNIYSYWIGRTKGDLWEENERFLGLARVSNPPYAFIVFSLNESNFGSIWLEFPEMIEINGEEIERLYLENSLISFLSKLKRGIFEDRIENYLPLEKKLYKNWGEDFWRVRKDKDKT